MVYICCNPFVLRAIHLFTFTKNTQHYQSGLDNTIINDAVQSALSRDTPFPRMDLY